MKSRNLFIGILILFIGVVALLAALNVFEFHWGVAWHLWPMILIICGVAILPMRDYLKSILLLVCLGLSCFLYHYEAKDFIANPVTRFFNNHSSSWNWNWTDDDDEEEYDEEGLEDQHFSAPYVDVERASLDIEAGAAEIKIQRPCAELVQIDAESDIVRYNFRNETGEQQANLYLSGQNTKKHLTGNHNNDLDIALSSRPLWTINLDLGASDSDLDFSPYRIEELSIDGGVCDLDIKLGDSGCDTKVFINSGVSDIDIEIPVNVGCRIHIDSAITDRDFIGFVKVEKGIFETPGFDSNEPHIEINLDCAVSDITVERY